jgi:hypothetical protein
VKAFIRKIEAALAAAAFAEEGDVDTARQVVAEAERSPAADRDLRRETARPRSAAAPRPLAKGSRA